MKEMQEMWVQSLSREDPLEKKRATFSSILAWRIPRTEEPGRLQSVGSHRVRHDWWWSTYQHKEYETCAEANMRLQSHMIPYDPIWSHMTAQFSLAREGLCSQSRHHVWTSLYPQECSMNDGRMNNRGTESQHQWWELWNDAKTVSHNYYKLCVSYNVYTYTNTYIKQ